MRWDLAGSSLGDSLKELGSSLGTRREIAGKKTGGLTVRLSEVAGVYRTMVGPPVPQNPGDDQRVSTGKLPRWRLDRPYHKLRVTTNG
ncbi:hypothetical protein B296_00035923 [Ensete ventricosum]|uniref:Uncharacterized protein n=1 Tax=Ensete ventricosum TaxID=4639 RepID=A0A426X7E0_ENSVE|nr:hypothetical protein B296_00035923 [Ensete ventricosum]